MNATFGTGVPPHTYGEPATAATKPRYPAGTPIAAASTAVSTGAPCNRCVHAVSATRARLPERSIPARSDDERCAPFVAGRPPTARPSMQLNVSERGSGNAAFVTTRFPPASPAAAERLYARSRVGCQRNDSRPAALDVPLLPLKPALAVIVRRWLRRYWSIRLTARYEVRAVIGKVPKPFVVVPSNESP